MPTIADFAKLVYQKMFTARASCPKLVVLRHILTAMYSASMRREEGTFVRLSVTFVDPTDPISIKPKMVRVDFPAFAPLESATPFTVDRLVKLGRAVNDWSGSLAIYGETPDDLVIWGILDQRVHYNVALNREQRSGYGPPGDLTIVIQGVGELAAFHSSLFLGVYRQDRIIDKEVAALDSAAVVGIASGTLAKSAADIARYLGEDKAAVLEGLLYDWEMAVARLCLGIRRGGTGGALIVSPRPKGRYLKVAFGLQYQRLANALAMRQLHVQYKERLEALIMSSTRPIPTDLYWDEEFAVADESDYDKEITGAIRLISSFAALDGAVLLTPDLSVLGFGVKLNAPDYKGKIFDGRQFAKKGSSAGVIEMASFGTRHASVVRYCKSDPKAIGIIISQDGNVRLVVTVKRSVTLWDNVKLLNTPDNPFRYGVMTQRWLRLTASNPQPTRFGYSDIPKSLKQLASVKPLSIPKSRAVLRKKPGITKVRKSVPNQGK